VPRDSVSKLVAILLELSKHAPDGFPVWLREALLHPAFPSQHLRQEDKQLVWNTVCLMRSQSEPRFRALFADVAAVCRGQNTAECLLSYQMT